MIIRKSAAEIDRIARAGALVAETIAHVGERIEPGITTLELDRIADEFIRARGGVPTSQGYKGYPRAICISVNDVVVHGIPDDAAVEDGDLVTIDVGVTLDGAIADSAYTFARRDDRRRVAAAPRRLSGRARRRDRRGAARKPDRRHLPCRAGGRRGSGLLGRQEPRRARRRPPLPRGPARPELRRARSRAAPLGGDDDRDRADDHDGAARGLARGGRLDDLDERRLPGRPFRAHRGHPAGRPADPDPARRRARPSRTGTP